jgi:hypothetical protein
MGNSPVIEGQDATAGAESKTANYTFKTGFIVEFW